MTTDPHTETQVDTTGWDLDWLIVHLRTVDFDSEQGNRRPLTDDEVEAMDGWLIRPFDRDWWTTDAAVGEAVGALRLIVDEAIFQRDLPRALDTLSRGRPLALAEQEAYEQYCADLVYAERFGL